MVENRANIRTALVKWPPMGRKKYMLDGALRGRNELVQNSIARDTGIKRDRKQVSSHIQVLKQLLRDQPGGEYLFWYFFVCAFSSPLESPRHSNTTQFRLQPILMSKQHLCIWPLPALKGAITAHSPPPSHNNLSAHTRLLLLLLSSALQHGPTDRLRPFLRPVQEPSQLRVLTW